MQTKERVQRRIAAIKQIDDPLEALRELADLTFEIGEEACHEREQIRELTETNRLCLMGNGDPEHSIVHKLGETVKCQAKMMEEMTSIRKALVGDLEDPDAPSLIGRLKDVERVIDNMRNVTWKLVSVFVGQLALFLWAFFIK